METCPSPQLHVHMDMHAFQPHNQSIAMQAYIENGEDYYVGKRRANEMRGIYHKSKILLDHPNDTKFLIPIVLYYNNEEYSKDDSNENHEFDFYNDMENDDLS